MLTHAYIIMLSFGSNFDAVPLNRRVRFEQIRLLPFYFTSSSLMIDPSGQNYLPDFVTKAKLNLKSYSGTSSSNIYIRQNVSVQTQNNSQSNGGRRQWEMDMAAITCVWDRKSTIDVFDDDAVSKRQRAPVCSTIWTQLARAAGHCRS